MSARTPRVLDFTATGEYDRPAVLFLHGFMGSKSDWASIANTLGRGFRCVAVDLPGHGSSLDLHDPAYTMDGAAKATVGLLNALKIWRACVVGYSMGGRLALYVALRYPGRCSGVFLESASPGLEGADERATRRRADEEKATLLETGDFEGFLENWYRQPLFAPLARDEDRLRQLLKSRLENDPVELARSLRGMGTGSQPSLWDELPSLRVPTLAVAGELDGKFVGISRRMESLSPMMRALAVPGTGHNVHEEAPSEYLSLLRRFLRER